MSGARKRCSCYATKGLRYVHIVITLLILMECSAKKMANDCEEERMMGYRCNDEPRCIRMRKNYDYDTIYDNYFCEDKVLISRWTFEDTTVYYEMECFGETKEDPYHYLSIILFANLSGPSYRFSNRAELNVSNCTAPSSNLSVLFGDWSTGGIGGWRNLALEKLTIECKNEKILHFSMHHWSGLKKLKELTIRCPKLTRVGEDLLSGISKRLEHLQLTDTEIQYFPERFFSNMEMMETLDLRRNKLGSFRRTFLSSMWNLETLDLGNNEIKSLDDDIFLQTRNLIVLKLERNSLTALPTSLANLGKLEELHGEYNRISFIPKDCLHSLRSLLRIYLNGNRLLTLGLASESITPTYNKEFSVDEMLPNSSSTLKQSRNSNNTWIGSPWISDLRLDNNSLSSLPHKAFHRMRVLEDLNISNNHITYLPGNIFSRNKFLRQLLASNNLFTHIPARLLRNNNELRKLDLSHNLIETLHEGFFSNTTELCHIDISDNGFVIS